MKVSADHKVAKYGCNDLPVKVGEYWEWQNDERVLTGYYVVIAGYGCSKTYKTAREAIYGMLREHACYNIRIADCEAQ